MHCSTLADKPGSKSPAKQTTQVQTRRPRTKDKSLWALSARLDEPSRVNTRQETIHTLPAPDKRQTLLNRVVPMGQAATQHDNTRDWPRYPDPTHHVPRDMPHLIGTHQIKETILSHLRPFSLTDKPIRLSSSRKLPETTVFTLLAIDEPSPLHSFFDSDVPSE